MQPAAPSPATTANAITARAFPAIGSACISTTGRREPLSATMLAARAAAIASASTPASSVASDDDGLSRAPALMAAPAIRVGTGGGTYEPWRDNFCPKGLAHNRELEYASRRLTAIEINATYYRLQKAESFAKWRDATPDGFVFSVKASQYSTKRKVLGEAGEGIEREVP